MAYAESGRLEPALAHVREALLLSPWDAWLDQDVDPDPSPEWFPAWLLLQEPGLARALGDDTAGSTLGPQRAFAILRQLLRREAVPGEEDLQVDARRALQQLHPGLLQLYLRRRDHAVP